jgi:hypothetical protein
MKRLQGILLCILVLTALPLFAIDDAKYSQTLTQIDPIDAPAMERPAGAIAVAPPATKRSFGTQTNIAENECTIPSGCAAWPTDPTGVSTIPGSTLCTSDYCPLCALDDTETKSICYKYYAQPYGYCQCGGRNTVQYDKYGKAFARCTTAGSCRFRR